jgi:D-xylose transport system substrate-binding protein
MVEAKDQLFDCGNNPADANVKTFGGLCMVGLVRRLSLTPLALVVLASCIVGPQAKQKSSENPPLKIGFLMDSLKVERWQTDLDAFQKRAKELGAEVLVETAEGDDALQFEQAYKLLNSGIKALVIVAHDTNEAVRIVASARAKNVPVVSYDRLIRNSNIDFFVGADAEAIGELQASALVKLAPTGNYVLIGGSPTDPTAKLLHAGQMKILKPLIDRGDIKLFADVWAQDWLPIEAYTHTIEVIEAFQGNITAIVASDDGTAGGAIQALRDHGLAGKVLVSGQDADLAAIIRILDGTQTMTVYKPVGSEARQAAEAAVSLAKGEAVHSSTSIANGNRNVPAFFVAPVVVTKDNVLQTVIKDGFQNLDTIQKSLPPEKWPK